MADRTVASPRTFFPLFTTRRKRKSQAERRQIGEARAQLYERSEEFCELRISPKCWRWITFESMHTCHVIHRSRGGSWDLDNLKAGCPECHIGWEHNGGKAMPTKERNTMPRFFKFALSVKCPRCRCGAGHWCRDEQGGS